MAGCSQSLAQADGHGGCWDVWRRHKAPMAKGIGSMLVATARQLARETIARTGGVGLVVDAANEEIVGFYARYGFRRVAPDGLRMFLPAASLEGGVTIPLE